METPHQSQADGDYNLPESYHAMVLLVDDQAFVANAVRRALAHQPDIDFHYCADPNDAICLSNTIKPTVILLDLVMPQMSGIALLRQLRVNPSTAETPIVVLSSKEEARTKSEAFGFGANDYLVKLPDAVEMRARVRYHTKALLNRIQRDETFKALRESQQELVKRNAELYIINANLEEASTELNELKKLLPICSSCRELRNDAEYLRLVDAYLARYPGTKILHRCPKCSENVENS